ncbi:putative chloride channel family protein [Afipia carboxidovorans OM5]|uniref:Putative chloride channel family protein n=2 Tax=Afipia carboxidovorans TaxID=40137 RepID=F8C0I5_AFIC5|nr:putative chloride channel family protein [Afipia carboxidovorans OM4]AEI06361.1 putative chloride channel family protein [Afipia carboxidovorans OM5]
MLVTVLQWLVLATLTGAIVGSGTSLFLHGLFFMTGQTEGIPLWLQMCLLPAGGLLNGLLLHYGYRLNTTGFKDTLFAAVHVQAGRMPFLTLPIKPIAAIITLASGGSAGKEGPCSHIGASLGAAIGQVFHLNSELRQRIVACGVSAGFASVFGTPIAGAIYGVEVLAIGRIRHDFLFPAVIAGIASYQVSLFWGVPYTYYPFAAPPAFSEILFLKIALLGVVCGVISLIFVELVHRARALRAHLQMRFDIWPPLMPLFGGILLALLILVIPTDYLGLSLPLMDRALAGESMPLLGFLWKSLLVAITIGSGFYGGIVTPQFVIGAVAGNALAYWLGLSPLLGAAAGLVSVVAASSNTPVAAILMGVELFGGAVGTLYTAGAAMAAYLMIGHRSIYPEQRLAYSKSSWMRIRPDTPVQGEKARLSYGLLRWWRERQQ